MAVSIRILSCTSDSLQFIDQSTEVNRLHLINVFYHPVLYVFSLVEPG